MSLTKRSHGKFMTTKFGNVKFLNNLVLSGAADVLRTVSLTQPRAKRSRVVVLPPVPRNGTPSRDCSTVMTSPLASRPRRLLLSSAPSRTTARRRL